MLDPCASEATWGSSPDDCQRGQAFAAAGFADQCQGFACVQREVDAVHGGNVAQADSQTAHFKNGSTSFGRSVHGRTSATAAAHGLL